MQTPITEMFDIEFPIVAFTHCRDVVVAVSKAGGLGVLGTVAHSDAQLETDLAAAALTDETTARRRHCEACRVRNELSRICHHPLLIHHTVGHIRRP